MKFILTADWHIRAESPICRTDDFMAAQAYKLDFIADLQQELECPVLLAGDLFNKWLPSIMLTLWTHQHMPKDVYTIAGNHDLKRHSMSMIEDTGLYLLSRFNTINLLDDFGTFKDCMIHTGHWKEPPAPPKKKSRKRRHIVVTHEMAFLPDEPPFPGATGNAEVILEKYRWADLIVTGHNHTPFTYKSGDQLLVNPGCLTRQKVDEQDHRPRVYVYDMATNGVEPMYIPIHEGVVSDSHVKNKAVRREDLEEYVDKIRDVKKLSINFTANMEAYLNINKCRKSIEDRVWKAIF